MIVAAIVLIVFAVVIYAFTGGFGNVTNIFKNTQSNQCKNLGGTCFSEEQTGQKCQQALCPQKQWCCYE
jgi:hypothetical protein